MIVTSTAAWEKLFSDELRVGFLAHANDLTAKLAGGEVSADQTAKFAQLIFNDYLDAGLTAAFLAITWVLVVDTMRVCVCIVARWPHPPSSESPHVTSRLAEQWIRD